MNIDYVMQAHGIGGKKISEEIPPPSVSNLRVIQDSTGTLFTLNWENPNDLSLMKIELYASTVDLSGRSYEEVSSIATKIVNDKSSSVTYVTTPNETYYFKAYAIYNIFGATKVDKGINGFLKAVDTVPPGNITNLTVEEDDQQLNLNWRNPLDTDFKKVIIVYKNTSYPLDQSDGTVAYEGIGTSVNLFNLISGTPYYFKAFTEDVNGNISIGVQFSGIPSGFKIYGVKIDTTNSNPESALTYTDNAVGFTPAKMGATTFDYGSWENVYPFNQIKPCVVKDGFVQYYLNPNDYSKKSDGTTADITSGNDGDVMVEFPKIWWKFETVGNDLYVRYCEEQKDSTYKCLAHQRETTEKYEVYISAYLGTEVSSKLRSLSGKTPTGNKTIGAFRTLAQANGSDYDQMAYYQLLMLQVLYIVMFKNRDSQTALGQGYTGVTNTASTTTGQLNNKGLFYGSPTNAKTQVKFCGVEDFYGNLLYWIDGIFSDASMNMLINNQSFNDTGSNYTNYGQGATANIDGYINSVQGGTETGFIPKVASGSATTYYADVGGLYASRIASFGGFWNVLSYAGAFSLRLNYRASGSYSIVGARLMFC